MECSAVTLRGAFTALVTPFSADGATVDFASLERLVEFQLGAGVRGVVIAGSTGEGMTLADSEYREVVKTVVGLVAGRVPCIAGVAANATSRAVSLATSAAAVGADGLMVVVPYYNKPSQEGIVQHVRAVRAAVQLPIIVYNIPGRTAANALPETAERLMNENLIAGWKDSTGSLDQAMDTLARLRGRVPYFSGEDALVLPLLACGGHGVISAVANIIPEHFVKICAAAEQGDWQRAREAQFAALPFVRACFMETNPVPVKAALALRGVIATATVRLPLLSAQASTVARFRELFVA